jgi:fatty-acyl-CoA synthase
MGGLSAERDVSLMSGGAVLKALQESGVDAHEFDLAKTPLSQLQVDQFDRVFIALHGRFGEDGTVLERDGKSVGEFEIRGPWITGSYFGVDDHEKFHDGWLRTGDVGTLDAEGFMVISDRSKDVIKSGGEWISSVELENEVIAHPEVFEAAVVAVPDARWDERPLCCVVRNPDSTVTLDEIREFLQPRIAKWWMPERWCFIEAVPKTSVGKFDKKVLRAQYAANELTVTTFE